MARIALIALGLGIAAGQFLFPGSLRWAFSSAADALLLFLMFSVGVSVGMNEAIFKKIREYRPSILLIPAGVTAGSLLGGWLCGLLLSMKTADSLAIGAAMGWYSLSGVMIEAVSGAEAGTIAFLSSLLRELLAFLAIPVLVKYLNAYCAIAAAGATSEDTTLPMLIRCGGEEYIIISVINGVLCSAAVPILINLIYSFF